MSFERSWIRRWFQRRREPWPSARLTGAGRLLVGAGCYLLILGLVDAYALLVQGGLYFILLSLSARWLCRLNLSGLTVSRKMPDGVAVGEYFDVALQLQNHKRLWAAFSIQMVDALGRPNRRESLRVAALGPGRIAEQTYTTWMHKRGPTGKRRITLRSDFPLGLAIAGRAMDVPGQIIVYPAPRLPAHVRMLIAEGYVQGHRRASSTRDPTDDFRMLREYQAGDHARLIAWAPSAKYARLVVREHERRTTPEKITLLFHSYEAPNTVVRGLSFERALRHMAGLLRHLRGEMIRVMLVADFLPGAPLDIPPSDAALDRALTRLARCHMLKTYDLDALSEHVTQAYRPDDAVMLVMSNTPLRYWTGGIPPLPVPIICIDNHEATILAPQGHFA